MKKTDIIEKHTTASGRTYGGLSPEKRRKQRRDQFLEAGLNIFGTKGFRSATVRSLCKEAKLTDRYFYESFGNLETLLMAVYEACMTDLSKKILHTIVDKYPDSSAPAALESGLDMFFLTLEDPRIARICMVELEGVSPEVDRLYNNYIQSFAHIIIILAKQAYPYWNVEDEELNVMGISLVGALRQAATHWLMTEYAAPRHTMVSGTSKLFTGLIELINNSDK